MKKICEKLSLVLKKIFGYGIMTTLFAGGLTFFGYIAALFIGGNVATIICTIIYKNIIPVIVYISVFIVLIGLVSMYLNGDVALTPEKKQSQKHKRKI